MVENEGCDNDRANIINCLCTYDYLPHDVNLSTHLCGCETMMVTM